MEEIKNEILALSSIYGEDFEELKPIWNQKCIKIKIKPHQGYPRKVPKLSIDKHQGLSQVQVDELKRLIQAEAKSQSDILNAQPYVFELIRVATDFLLLYDAPPTKSFYEQMEQRNVDKETQDKLVEKQKLLAEQQNQQITENELLMKVEQEIKRKESLWKKNQSVKSPGSNAVPKPPPSLENNGHVEQQDRILNPPDEEVKPSHVPLASTVNQKDLNSRYHNDFDEIEVIGKGGFGTVVKSVNKLDSITYAVKKIKLDIDNEALNVKVIREVVSLAKMFHQHIVRYYQAWIEESYLDMEQNDDDEYDDDDEDTNQYSYHSNNLLQSGSNYYFDYFDDEDDDIEAMTKNDSLESTTSADGEKLRKRHVLFIQMEYCEGQTLREVIDKGELYKDKDQVFRLLRQILLALSYVHSTCHFIHRDLKPPNIFLDQDGNVKLGDFGLATERSIIVNEASPPGERNNENVVETSITEGIGTALYRAPEVTNHKSDDDSSPNKFQTYDQKCDMFSLGIILFEMCYPPFSTGMERHVVLSELATNLKFPDNFFVANKSEDEQAIHGIISSLLNKDPDKRPSASELLTSQQIPQRVETENQYLNEVLHAVKSAKPNAPLYSKLIEALFDQQTRFELYHTYDYSNSSFNYSNIFSGSKYSSSITSHMSSNELLKYRPNTQALITSSVYVPERLFPEMKVRTISNIARLMTAVFELYGAVPVSPPIMNPKPPQLQLRQDNKEFEFDDVIYSSKIQKRLYPARFIDPQGTVVSLPITLTQNFARWIASQGIKWLKRYEIGKVYHAGEGVAIGGQPSSSTQASFDLIMPLPSHDISCSMIMVAAGEVEVLACTIDALKSAVPLKVSDSNRWHYLCELSNTKLQHCILELCEIDVAMRPALVNLLGTSKYQFETWNNLRQAIIGLGIKPKYVNNLRAFILVDQKYIKQTMRLDVTEQEHSSEHNRQQNSLKLENIYKLLREYESLINKSRGKSRSSIDVGLESIASLTLFLDQLLTGQQNHLSYGVNLNLIRFSTWLKLPSNDYLSGFCFRILLTTGQDNKHFPAAQGGRFDRLIQHFQKVGLPGYVIQKAGLVGIGSRLHLDRIAVRLKSVQSLYTIKVLVCLPSDGGMQSNSSNEASNHLCECCNIVKELRGRNVSAEWIHPAGLTVVLLEEYCKCRSIPIMIWKGYKNYRVKSIQGLYPQHIDRDNIKREALIDFIFNLFSGQN